jgi:hypothetical protein
VECGLRRAIAEEQAKERGAIVSSLLIEALIYERPNSIDVLYLIGAHAPTDAYPMDQCIYACNQA